MSEKRYRCIKKFYVPLCDDDGYEVESGEMAQVSDRKHDPRRDYIGKKGAYYKTHVGSGARIVCLRCMASFRTRMATVFLDGLQDTWVQTRFCPCCGSELTQLITPDTPARDGQTMMEVDA